MGIFSRNISSRGFYATVATATICRGGVPLLVPLNSPSFHWPHGLVKNTLPTPPLDSGFTTNQVRLQPKCRRRFRQAHHKFEKFCFAVCILIQYPFNRCQLKISDIFDYVFTGILYQTTG